MTYQLRLLPTESQVSKLNEVLPRLRAARNAVSKAQREYHQKSGKYYIISDVGTASPKVRIPEAVAIAKGVTDAFIVRGWLQAGLTEGRGGVVDETKVNRLLPKSITSESGESFLRISNIGTVKIDAYNPQNASPSTAYLLYPDEHDSNWRVTFEGNTPVPTESDADSAPQAEKDSERNGEECFVYFAQEDNDNRIKIGSAKNPKERMNSLGTGVPGNLTLLASTPGDSKIERQIQNKFEKYQIRKEWFNPAPELIKFIVELNAQPKDDEDNSPVESRHEFGYLLCAVGMAVKEHGIEAVKTAIEELD